MSETAVLEVVTRARNDEAFRKLLLTNPKAAFAAAVLSLESVQQFQREHRSHQGTQS